MKKKGYSEYENPKAREKNRKPVNKSSVIVANLSDYEDIPDSVKDHKRQSNQTGKSISEYWNYDR